MIADIVELPRRLRQFKGRKAYISSEAVIGLPISQIGRMFGYNTYDDDSYMCFGTHVSLPTGNDALFRYKIIEPIKNGISEYFILTQSPIDIRRPYRSKHVKCICPWVSITNPKTMFTTRFCLWNHMFELGHYETEDTVVDAPIRGVIVDTLRKFAEDHGWDEMTEHLKSYNCPTKLDNIVLSEYRQTDDDIQSLAMLASNIRAYEDMMATVDPCHWCDSMDVLRGVDLPKIWSDTVPAQGCTLLRRIINGSFYVNDLIPYFGMNYDVHAFQRPFNPSPLDPFTEISPNDDTTDKYLFQVLKYICTLPYNEFKMILDKEKLIDFVLYDQYNLGCRLTNENAEHMRIVGETAKKLSDEFKNNVPKLKRATIVRSWGSEIYITLVYDDPHYVTQNFFYDEVASALGTRALIRDYDGRLF